MEKLMKLRGKSHILSLARPPTPTKRSREKAARKQDFKWKEKSEGKFSLFLYNRGSLKWRHDEVDEWEGTADKLAWWMKPDSSTVTRLMNATPHRTEKKFYKKTLKIHPFETPSQPRPTPCPALAKANNVRSPPEKHFPCVVFLLKDSERFDVPPQR